MKKYQSRIIAAALVLGVCFLLVFTAKKAEEEKYQGGPLAVEKMEIQNLEMAVSSAKTIMNKERFQKLESELENIAKSKSGRWNIYVKNLSTGDSISINNEQGKAASLIKLFVMAYVYEHLDTSNPSIQQNIQIMITHSDNEAYNSLVRTCGSGSFANGAIKINQWLEENSYVTTKVYNTLEPSRSAPTSIAPYSNPTSVEECGRLLEEIYNGTCVSKEASQEMLDLLCQQVLTSKIPQGIPDEVVVANKTGEALDRQHDVAIVFGPKADYILCVMSEGTYKDSAIFTIRDISEMVYQYLQ